MPLSAPIALFYGSSTCYTEFVGEKIAASIGLELVDMFNVASEPPAKMQEYSNLILGIPTWDYGELQEDWEEIWPGINDLDLRGKKIALFGVGDQLGYPDWFLDAMGYLHDIIVARGATVVGYWPAGEYKFVASQALTADKKYFVGLAIDEENEFALTDQRISEWTRQILQDFDL